MLARKQENVKEIETAQVAAPVAEIAEGELVHTMMSCSIEEGSDMFDGDQVQAMMSCS
ncbi:hypothetical protein [Primorskyibacter sp. S187A]|uniref:hypothetical protein n=1 Tax=Primorskyibacter sp. S187A TaxID=3415130 RepID=UPI003C7B36BE